MQIRSAGCRRRAARSAARSRRAAPPAGTPAAPKAGAGGRWMEKTSAASPAVPSQTLPSSHAERRWRSRAAGDGRGAFHAPATAPGRGRSRRCRRHRTAASWPRRNPRCCPEGRPGPAGQRPDGGGDDGVQQHRAQDEGDHAAEAGEQPAGRAQPPRQHGAGQWPQRVADRNGRRHLRRGGEDRGIDDEGAEEDARHQPPAAQHGHGRGQAGGQPDGRGEQAEGGEEAPYRPAQGQVHQRDGQVAAQPEQEALRPWHQSGSQESWLAAWRRRMRQPGKPGATVSGGRGKARGIVIDMLRRGPPVLLGREKPHLAHIIFVASAITKAAHFHASRSARSDTRTLSPAPGRT
jgi:hypothetical protein